VLDTLKNARANGIWVEVSNLVVPELTDSMEGIRQLCAWVVQNLGATTPLHFLRFTPMYKLANLYPTPEKTLRAAAAAARKAGLKFVYLGNVPGSDDNTCCPSCGKPVIERQGYLLRSVSVKHGACAFCGAKMPGVWEG
jgi:pyruvate formate lyase activating enzyme